jgi:hypothetical protein
MKKLKDKELSVIIFLIFFLLEILAYFVFLKPIKVDFYGFSILLRCFLVII